MKCNNCKFVNKCKRQCMDLPEGKTCENCFMFEKCKMFLGNWINEKTTKCSFEPIKFQEKKDESKCKKGT